MGLWLVACEEHGMTFEPHAKRAHSTLDGQGHATIQTRRGQSITWLTVLATLPI